MFGIVFVLLAASSMAALNFYGFDSQDYDEYASYSVIYQDGKNITIRQLEDELIDVYSTTPPKEKLESSSNIIYITEHYDPDLKIEDDSRESGEKRLTAVVKRASVQIENSLIIKTEPLLLNTKSLLSHGHNNREIDVLYEKAAEIFSVEDNIVFEISSYELSEDYDRGFNTGLSYEYVAGFSGKEFVDVVPNTDCSKFGFVYYPDDNYNYMKKTIAAYALGIAYAEEGIYNLDNMEIFVKEAYENDLVPIVRVLGEHKYEQVLSSDEVAGFITALKESTDGKLKYVQIWDKPNANEGGYFDYAQSYAEYVTEIKGKLDDPEIKIISASLESNILTEEGNSMDYLNTLLKIPEFWDSIDYWAGSAYNKQITDKNYCVFEEEASMIETEQKCLSSIYAYEKELQLIYTELGIQPEIFITDAGYPLDMEENNAYLAQYLKEDPNIKAVLMFLANGWAEVDGSSWIDESSGAYKEVCS